MTWRKKLTWRSRSLVVTVATIAILALVAPAPASAATEPVSPPSDNKIVLSDATTSRELTAQEQIDVDAVLASTNADGTVFDADAALAAGALPETVDAVASAIQGNGGTVTSAYTPNANAESLIAAAVACTGKSRYNGYFTPWGFQFAMNSCQADRVTAAVGLGAAAAGVITAVLLALKAPPKVLAASGLIAAIIAFGAAALAACKAFSSNGGIYLNVGGRPVVSCWGQ